jgi:hypothetical protein
MKPLALAIALLITLPALPALANDPSMQSSSSTTTTTSTGTTGRQHWVKQRMHHLKSQMAEDEKAQKTADKMDYFIGKYPERSATYTRQRMISRFEYLALKSERRGLTANEAYEMRMLQASLMHH